jgi:hypothetical protein
VGSSTRLTTFSRLANKGDLGVVLGRLMIALNDCGLADEGLKRWSAENSEKLQDRKIGARMYHVRMLIAHAFEALLVINKIKSDPALLKAVEACDRQTVASFKKVAARIGTVEYKMMKSVRNNVSFHYQDAIVRQAIKSQNNKNPSMPLSLSVGHTPLDWYCEPGDKLVDSAVVRQIFEVPEGADVRTEVDRIVVRIYELATDLSEFAGYFIRHYAR